MGTSAHDRVTLSLSKNPTKASSRLQEQLNLIGNWLREVRTISMKSNSYKLDLRL